MTVRVGDKVRVKKAGKHLFEQDCETEYYVGLFAGKVGIVTNVSWSTEGHVSVSVDFEKDAGIFYEDEVELVTR